MKLFIYFVLALAPVATAEPIPEVQNFLQEEIIKMSQQMHDIEDVDSEVFLTPESTSNEFVFSAFRLGLQGEVGFDVGAVAKLTLVPQIEFGWR